MADDSQATEAQPHIPIARPVISDEEKRRVVEVLESGMLAAGRQVRAFERAFATYVGVRAGVATSSGTTALQVALEALGIGQGHAVVTTPFTFVATSNAILHAGARPVFADVDARTFNLDPAAVEEAVRSEPVRAILCVHLYGLPCDLHTLSEIAARHELLLIEDCAQAHGARDRGRSVGSVGDAGIFSFYASKNMTTGEGGMIVTDDEGMAHRMRLLVNVGQDGSRDYVYETIGYNYRMTDIAGALGLVQLQRLDEHNAIRRRHASRFTEAFARLDWLLPPGVPPGKLHGYNQYTVRILDDRERFVRHLADHGIGYRIYYPQLVPDSPAYRRLGFGGRYPVAETLAAQVVSLPVHPALSDEDVDRIIDGVTRYRPSRG